MKRGEGWQEKEEDQFGHDPSVRRLRRVFAAAEAGQNQLLDRLNIGRLDRRLGQWRKVALHLFERGWARATREGVHLEEEDVGHLYLFCLARALATRGIAVPGEALPANAAVARLLEEKLPAFVFSVAAASTTIR